MSEHVSLIREAVARNVGAATAASLTWADGKVPTIANVAALRNCEMFRHLDNRFLLLNISERTALEGGNKSWRQVLDDIDSCPATEPSAAAFDQMARAFTANVAPMARQQSTRAQQWRNWRAVLTLAVAHGVVDRLLPMHKDTLYALSWQLITLHCSASHMEQVWGAIAHRHSLAGLPSPLAGKGEYSQWKKSLSVMQGRPSPLKFPIRKDHIWRLLSLPGLSTASYVMQRNVLAAVLGVLCCARVSEMAELQACDVLFDFDTLRGSPGYEGTAAIRIRKRKNDTLRKGLFPRLGRARRQGTMFDVVAWLQIYMWRFELTCHPECDRDANDRERCPRCPPLFVQTARRGKTTKLTARPCSRQNLGQAMVRALGYIQVNTTAFSGISARKGGLSTAIEAGVPEAILFMQSGHGQSKAARAYVSLNSPKLLFDTWAAFGL